MTDASRAVQEFPTFCTEIVSNYSRWKDRGKPSSTDEPELKSYLDNAWSVMMGTFTLLIQVGKGLSRSSDAEGIAAVNQMFDMGLRAAELLDEMGRSSGQAMPIAPELRRLVGKVAESQRA